MQVQVGRDWKGEIGEGTGGGDSGGGIRKVDYGKRIGDGRLRMTDSTFNL